MKPFFLSTLSLLVAGCVSLLPAPNPVPDQWVLNPAFLGEKTAGPLKGPLKIAEVMAPSDLSGKAIMVQTHEKGTEIVTHLKEAEFSTPLPSLIQNGAVRFFEDSGHFTAVGMDHEPFRVSEILHITIRDWFVRLKSDNKPHCVVLTISAKLMKSPGHTLIKQRVFSHTVRINGHKLSDIHPALNKGFQMILSDLQGWVLKKGTPF